MGKKKVTGISSMEDYSSNLLDAGGPGSLIAAAQGAKLLGSTLGAGSLIGAAKGAKKLRKQFKKATSRVRGH